MGAEIANVQKTDVVFGGQERASSTMAEAQISRQASEVQAAMVIAKRFPRDETASYSRIMRACKRRSLAECAMYAYPRGGETVTGPSIRLAEAMAQAWGNLDFGIVELEQRNGASEMMAYAWDLETNTRQTKVFSVPHERHTRSGAKRLTDPRDVYELTANQGARRLRACILGIIPGDVVDAAVEECERTLKGGNTEPIADRARKMVALFEPMGVTQAQIEKRLGHNVAASSETELVTMRKIYQSIRDGMSAVADHFDVGAERLAFGTVPAVEALAAILERDAAGTSDVAPEPAAEPAPAAKPATKPAQKDNGTLI